MSGDTDKFSEAVRLWKAAADVGSARDQLAYGYCLAKGSLTPSDPAGAASYFKLAADQGLADGLFNYGVHLLNGLGVPINFSEARDCFEKAAAQDHTSAAVNNGYCLATTNSLSAAMEWFRKAADQGHATGEFNYGLGKYLAGDHVAATRYFEVSAGQRFPPGQINLGVCLFKGDGVPRDEKRAVTLFEQAGDHPVAQFNLGYCLLKGHGVAQDRERAAAYILQSSRQDYPPAHVVYAHLTLKSAKLDVQKAVRFLNKVGSSLNNRQCFGMQMVDNFLSTNELVRPTFVENLSILDFATDFESAEWIALGDVGSRLAIRRMQRRSDGMEVAVKYFIPTFILPSHVVLKQFFRELSALRDVRHPCVVELVGFQMAQGGGAIGSRFMRNGSLADVLARVKAEDRPEFWTTTGIVVIVMGLVLGMRFMHAQHIIHRNLKPSNLFITDEGHLQIGDLTWCRFSNGVIAMTGQPGSAHYQAPDIYETDQYTEKVDVFSFGLVLFEIIAGTPVFSPDLNPRRVMRKVLKKEFVTIPDHWMPTLRDLLMRCWRIDSQLRPSFAEIADYLENVGFQILPGVETSAVQAFVAEVNRAE